MPFYAYNELTRLPKNISTSHMHSLSFSPSLVPRTIYVSNELDDFHSKALAQIKHWMSTMEKEPLNGCGGGGGGDGP